MVYAPSGTTVVDVSTAQAYSTVQDDMDADYVSGAGVADILPYMGLSTLTLPVYAVIDLETAVLRYYQDGSGGNRGRANNLRTVGHHMSRSATRLATSPVKSRNVMSRVTSRRSTSPYRASSRSRNLG